MRDISEIVLETLEKFREISDKTQNIEYKRLLEDTYFKVVDTAYPRQISKQIAYRKLWYITKRV